MILLDVDPQDFAKNNDLPIEQVTCPRCRKTVPRDQPYRTREGKGLSVRPHNGCTWSDYIGNFENFSLSGDD